MGIHQGRTGPSGRGHDPGWRWPERTVDDRAGLFACVALPEARRGSTGRERPGGLFEAAVLAHGGVLAPGLSGRDPHVGTPPAQPLATASAIEFADLFDARGQTVSDRD